MRGSALTAVLNSVRGIPWLSIGTKQRTLSVNLVSRLFLNHRGSSLEYPKYRRIIPYSNDIIADGDHIESFLEIIHDNFNRAFGMYEDNYIITGEKREPDMEYSNEVNEYMSELGKRQMYIQSLIDNNSPTIEGIIELLQILYDDYDCYDFPTDSLLSIISQLKKIHNLEE